MTTTLANIRPHDRVEVTFKRTLEARSAVRRLWAMHGESRDNMFFLSVGTPRIDLPDEEAWMLEGWEGNLARGFVFTASSAFDVEYFQHELGGHIEAIMIKN